jgi:hypothetical protein
MSRRSAMRATLAPPIALGLSLLLSTAAAAASWTSPTTIDSGLGYSGPYSAELVPLTGSTVVVGYGMTNGADIDHVVVRRSNDAGATWKKPTVVTDHGWAPSTAGRGTDVDVVWLWNGRVRYAHSTDTGATFGGDLSLSPLNAQAFTPRVARGPNGLVAVVWNQEGVVRGRVSTDGGNTFAASITIARNGVWPVIAIGAGVIYVLYSHGENFDKYRVIRSLDGGETWGAALIAGPQQSVYYSITAEGNRAYIAYETSSDDTHRGLHYRGTLDRGANWSQARNLLPASWNGYNPLLSLRGGVLRAVFVPCHDSGDVCDDSGRVFFRQTSDGIHWSTPDRVSPKSLYSEPRGVGFSGRAIVLYQANTTRFYVPVLFSRSRMN